MTSIYRVDTEYIVAPADTVDKSPPSEQDVASTTAMEAFLQHAAPLATSGKHEVALKKLYGIFRAWLDPTMPFQMFVSGSYRMGVHTEDADIDVVFVVPEAVTRAAVFTRFLNVLQVREDITDLQPVPDARVPIIGLALDGQDFDIMTCHVPAMHLGPDRSLPPRADLLDTYNWMNGADEASILSFNGPRVTEILLRVAPADRKRHFLLALRFLRVWAKRRAVYSNKCGYLGGVNLALLACFAAMRRPLGVASTIVAHVFELFAGWRWTLANPVALGEEGLLKCPPWLRTYEWAGARHEAMVVLTPCFPRTNSMFSASEYTRDILQGEFRRAFAGVGPRPGADWEAVCRPYSALATCPRFVALIVAVEDTPAGRTWQGYAEAQIRYLARYLSRQDFAVKEFRYIPVWCTHVDPGTTTRTRSTFITAEDDGVIRTFMVKGRLDKALEYFEAEHLSLGHGPPRPPASKVHVQFVRSADIPDDAFKTHSRQDLLRWAGEDAKAANVLRASEGDAGGGGGNEGKGGDGDGDGSPPRTSSDTDDTVLARHATTTAEYLYSLPGCIQHLARIRENLEARTAGSGDDPASKRRRKADAPKLAHTFPKPTGLSKPALTRSGLQVKKGSASSSWPVVSQAPQAPQTSRTSRTPPSQRNHPIPSPSYCRIKMGAQKTVQGLHDIYIGPAWGALKCPHACLVLGDRDVKEFEECLHAEAKDKASVRRILSSLGGKRLGCWCKDEDLCHAGAIFRVWKHHFG
jgi:poly(A) polymerase